ncbi:hypothetical protein ACLBWS_18235 [Brucellaceae bacterium D45D]
MPEGAEFVRVYLSDVAAVTDLGRLVRAAVEAPETQFAVVWGISANTERWWQNDDGPRIGYQPHDDASRFGDLPEKGATLERRFQGCAFPAEDYSRE